MTNAKRMAGVALGCVILLSAAGAGAQDWPQWRGPNRDGKATGFKAPKAWPKALTEKWRVKVGDGVATPALVGDKLYVFSRQDGKEITRCLKASDGEEVWKDEYESGGATGAASGFPGPRASPVVADGKVVTFGVRGVLSCLDAGKGTKLWRKDDFKGSVPKFFTSSSPLVTDGLVVAQLGGESKGAVAAYDLKTGEQKWKWDGDGSAYASPILLTVGKDKVVIAETSNNIVAIKKDGKVIGKVPFAPEGFPSYNSSTPVADGQTIIFGGGNRDTKAVKFELKGGELTAKELWKNEDYSLLYNSPVLKDGLLYCISHRDSLFCIDAKTGKTAWATRLKRGGQRQQGYGSIVDAGAVLFALNPTGELVVFEPSAKELKTVAKYQVAKGGTFAYPVVAGNRVFVKDRDSVILWAIEEKAE
jgi:outer membrane protein assembly factor BamB